MSVSEIEVDIQDSLRTSPSCGIYVADGDFHARKAMQGKAILRHAPSWYEILAEGREHGGAAEGVAAAPLAAASLTLSSQRRHAGTPREPKTAKSAMRE